MRKPLVALVTGIVVVGALARTSTALAEGPVPQLPQTAPNSDADAFLCDTIQRLVETLGQVLQDVPRYAPPAIDRDGNIILRRLNPPGPTLPLEPPPGGWTLDQTSA